MLREAQARDEASDVSPGGRYEVRVEADSVVLTDLEGGKSRTLPVKDLTPKQATVSDRGDVAVVCEAADRQGQVVGRLAADGTVDVVARSYGLGHPELSSDGSRLTWLTLYDVNEVGPQGPRLAAKLPYIPDRSQFLEDGRILVRSDRDPWGTGKRVPYYWIFDGQGTMQGLDDVALAETLGVPVREQLLGVHERLFGRSTREQREHLVDLFGYRTPTYRALSRFGEKSVFWVEPGAPGKAFGLYRMEPGKGLAQAALSEADQALVGSRRVTSSEWQEGLRRVAVAFEGEPAPRRLAVVDFEGGSRVLPRALAGGEGGRAAYSWSPDGKWLSMEADEAGRRAVYVYDVETGDTWPVVPEGRVTGWKDGFMEVEVDGAKRLLIPGPLDGERGREYVLGPKPEPAGTIEEGPGEVRVGDVSLPVRG